MKGGSEKTVPLLENIVGDPNDPSIPATVRASRQPPPQQSFLELKINPVQKPQAPRVPIPPSNFMSSPMTYPSYPNVFGQATPVGTFSAPVNVVNQLVIGDNTPYQDNIRMNKIYEDVLPMKQLPTMLGTIGERNIIYSFVKSSVLKGADGENIPFRNGPNNLYDKLKTTTLNPYHVVSEVTKNNPYATLPKNMLLYRSCYPIKQIGGTVNCARDSVGINIRIYRLKISETSLVMGTSDMTKSDIWREIMFYEYIRTEILNKNVSPNFVMLYGYSICNDSAIDFDVIDQLKPTSRPVTVGRTPMIKMGDVFVPNMNEYKNDILIALTESPTYNLIQWATTMYANSPKQTKVMLTSGYHTDDEWNSVIFQLLVAFIVMYTKGIYINGFNLRDNVYVKEVKTIPNVTNYWKYIIQGIQFFIPNNGFVVQIDSKFKDIAKNASVLPVKQPFSDKKIYCDPFNNKLESISLRQKILDTIKLTFTSNYFNQSFANIEGGMRPSNKVIDLINNISEELKTIATADDNTVNKLVFCVVTKMSMFLNNRIGTPLTVQELEGISQQSSIPPSTGDMVVIDDTINRTKNFALYLGNYKDGDQNKHIILPNTVSGVEAVLSGVIQNYSKVLPIKQNYKAGLADENEILETYYVS